MRKVVTTIEFRKYKANYSIIQDILFYIICRSSDFLDQPCCLFLVTTQKKNMTKSIPVG